MERSSSSSKIASTGIAVLGGAQVVLTVIEKLMDSIPLPFVKGAAGAAVEVIKMARVIHSNKKECDELVNRSTSLLVVILSSLKGKTANEIPDDLKQAVERLSLNFQEVLSELQIVDKRAGKKTLTGPLRAVVYHHDNSETLRGCCAKLDWAMQEFQVTSRVESCLRDLEHHETVIKSQVELKDGLAELREAMLEGIHSIMEAVKEKEVEHTISSLPSTRLPPNPRIFGRTEYVSTAVKLLLREESARLAILGPGGMGKTSTALKIVHDSQVVSRFRKNIHWVPCEQATSLPLLVELLAKSLQLPVKSSNDRLNDVATALEASDNPHLFLLDNFETPWDIPTKQSDVADVLSLLGSILSVSFILTMRGIEHPASDIVEWSMPRLPVLTQLELDAAREAFLKIAPNAAGDPELNPILKELDCMPLAITLMAKLSSQGELPSELLLQWKSEKTGLLMQVDGDRRSCIEVSIKLSLDSRAVRAVPEAIELLGILAILPGGAAIARLPEICPSITNWKRALRVLRNSALSYLSPDETLAQALSPIRSYMLLHHPLSDTLLHDLQKFYTQLADKGKAVPGDSDFNANVDELGQEQANLEFILLDMLSNGGSMKEEALEASLSYSSYCFWTLSQTTIIRSAVNAANISGSPLLPKCLITLGNILWLRDEYEEAMTVLEDARAKFIAIEDQLGAAKCLMLLGDVLQIHGKFDGAKVALEDARAKFVTLGNQLGVAQCLMSLGDILRLQRRYEEAIVVLKEARAKSIELGDQLCATQSLQLLGDILTGQKRYDESKAALEEARDGFTVLGNQLGVMQCLISLGGTLRLQRRYEEAIVVLKEARAKSIGLGDRLCATQSLQLLGDILIGQKRYDESKAALEEARDGFTVLGNQRGATLCLKSLGNILKAQNKHDEARAALEEARAMFVKLEDQLGVAKCLKSLGDVLKRQGRYDEAEAALEEARTRYNTLGDQLGATQCLQSLSKILKIQNRYDEAKAILEEARTSFITLGCSLDAAWCLKSIGGILYTQSRYNDARSALEPAIAQLIALGDKVDAAWALKLLGQALYMQDKYDEAQTALTEARHQFITLEIPLGANRCLLTLADILIEQGQYDEALKDALEEARNKFLLLDKELDSNECLQSLGDILRIQGRHDEARRALEEARDKFISLRDHTSASQCEYSLSQIKRIVDDR